MALGRIRRAVLSDGSLTKHPVSSGTHAVHQPSLPTSMLAENTLNQRHTPCPAVRAARARGSDRGQALITTMARPTISPRWRAAYAAGTSPSAYRREIVRSDATAPRCAIASTAGTSTRTRLLYLLIRRPP